MTAERTARFAPASAEATAGQAEPGARAPGTSQNSRLSSSRRERRRSRTSASHYLCSRRARRSADHLAAAAGIHRARSRFALRWRRVTHAGDRDPARVSAGHGRHPRLYRHGDRTRDRDRQAPRRIGRSARGVDRTHSCARRAASRLGVDAIGLHHRLARVLPGRSRPARSGTSSRSPVKHATPPQATPP